MPESKFKRGETVWIKKNLVGVVLSTIKYSSSINICRVIIDTEDCISRLISEESNRQYDINQIGDVELAKDDLTELLLNTKSVGVYEVVESFIEPFSLEKLENN